MSVRVSRGELNAGRVHWLARHITLARGRVQGETVHIAGGNGGVGQPDLFIKSHVELWTQADCIKDDGIIFPLL